MPTEQMQEMAQQSDEMTPEEAKAALGLATSLVDQTFLPQLPQEEESMPQEESQEPQIDQEALMEGIKMLIQEEVGTLREEIQNALREEDDDKEE